MLANEAVMTYMKGRDHAKYMDANVTALQVCIIIEFVICILILLLLFRIVITISLECTR